MMKAKREDVYEFIDTSFEILTKFLIDFNMLLRAYTQDLNDEISLGSPHRFPRPQSKGTGVKWSKLKEFAMKENYPANSLRVSVTILRSYYIFQIPLSSKEKEELESLIAA